MAQVVCSSCDQPFESDNHALSPMAAGVLGGAAGFVLGSGVGMAAGPFGIIAGSLPGAIVGGTLASLGSSKFVKCPHCNQIEML